VFPSSSTAVVKPTDSHHDFSHLHIPQTILSYDNHKDQHKLCNSIIISTKTPQPNEITRKMTTLASLAIFIGFITKLQEKLSFENSTLHFEASMLKTWDKPHPKRLALRCGDPVV